MGSEPWGVSRIKIRGMLIWRKRKRLEVKKNGGGEQKVDLHGKNSLPSRRVEWPGKRKGGSPPGENY